MSTSQPKPPKVKKIKTTWVNSLNKAALEAYLKECGMDDVGSVEELRRRLATYIAGGHYSTEVHQRLSELEKRHTQQAPTYQLCVPVAQSYFGLPSEHSQVNIATSTPPSVMAEEEWQTAVNNNNQRHHFVEERVRVPDVDDRTFDRVRTWGLQFNDRTDPIDFIERVEELARSQRVPLDQVPFTLSESFRGKPLAWWRNRRHEWTGWSSFQTGFLRFFLPSNFWDDLEDAIRRRQQREDESFKDYALALETLMRHTHYDHHQKLERIYKNSLPAIRLLVKRREFETLDELTDLISHIEFTRGPIGPENPMPTREITRNLQSRQDHRPKETPARTAVTNGNPVSTPARGSQEKPSTSTRTEFVQNPRSACRKCAEQGHQAANCTNATRYFCWQCGKMGVITKNCCPQNTAKLNTVHAQRMNLPEKMTNLKLSTPEYQGQSIRCQVMVGKQVFWAILDTGSCHSYVDKKVISQLPSTVYAQESCRFTITTATGEQSRVTSSLNVRFQFQDSLITNTLLVLQGCTEQFILGMDFMTKIGTTFLFGQNPAPITIAAQLGMLKACQIEATKEVNEPFQNSVSNQPKSRRLQTHAATSVELDQSTDNQQEVSPIFGYTQETCQPVFTAEPEEEIASLDNLAIAGDILDISTSWYEEVLMNEAAEQRTIPEKSIPSRTMNLATLPKAKDRETLPLAKDHVEELTRGLNHLSGGGRRRSTGSVRGRSCRRDDPSKAYEPPPCRTRCQTSSLHRREINVYAEPASQCGQQGVYPPIPPNPSPDQREQRREDATVPLVRHPVNRTRRHKSYDRTVKTDLGVRAEGSQRTGYRQDTTPSVDTSELDNQEVFDPWDDRTWPDSLRQLADDYQHRAQQGERFPRRCDLHFDNGNRYRVALKRDGQIHVTKLPPKADE